MFSPYDIYAYDLIGNVFYLDYFYSIPSQKFQ